MYCKNCGSILLKNANFCHVCGTKMDVEDVFLNTENEKKDEVSQEDGFYNPNMDQSFGATSENQEDGFYHEQRSEESNFYPNENATLGLTQEEKKKKNCKVPAIIGFVGSIMTLIDGFVTYGYRWIISGIQLDSSQITYDQYLSIMFNALLTSIVYFMLGAIAGIVLGSIGFVNCKKYDNKTGKNLGITSIIFGSICLIVAVCFIAYRVSFGL